MNPDQSRIDVLYTNVYRLDREGDPKGWSTVLVTALGSWEKTVSRGHRCVKLFCCTGISMFMI
jgi:hypothetical protein